jgi:hypothetical protein
MAHRLTFIDGVRFVGDARRKVVHDRWHGECEDCILDDLLGQGHAVGFVPDQLSQALEEGYDYCDWCIDGSDPEPPSGWGRPRESRRSVMTVAA